MIILLYDTSNKLFFIPKEMLRTLNQVKENMPSPWDEEFQAL
jgi:hypothetical protein